jgi:hypothetical protein
LKKAKSRRFYIKRIRHLDLLQKFRSLKKLERSFVKTPVVSIHLGKTIAKKSPFFIFCNRVVECVFKIIATRHHISRMELDRVERDLIHLTQLIDKLNERNIKLKVLAGSGAQIDITTANGRMMFALFAVLAEFERELIVERTQAGLVAARALGRFKGRPRRMDKERNIHDGNCCYKFVFLRGS